MTVHRLGAVKPPVAGVAGAARVPRGLKRRRYFALPAAEGRFTRRDSSSALSLRSL